MVSSKADTTQQNLKSTVLAVTKSKLKTETKYFLIKLKNDANFFSVFHQLNSLEGITKSLATKGEAEIFFEAEKIRNEFSFSDLETKVNSIDGVKQVTCLNVRKQFSISEEKEKGKIFSILLMLVEAAKLDDITKELLQSKSVAFCNELQGKYNLMAELSSDSFTETDKYISNYVVSMPGVLKVKELPLINLYE